MKNHHATALEPDAVLDVWRRRKWIGLVAFAIALAGATAVALSLPNLYQATATVLVERQRVSEAFIRPSVTDELETRIQTIHQQVMSRARLADLIDRFGLYADLTRVVPTDALVERMRREIQLTLKGAEQTNGRNGTIAFALSYSGRDPATVARVANSLASFYVEENTKSRARQATQTAEFLKAQLADVEQELDARERRVSEFKRRYAGDLQQVEVTLTAIDRLTTQLRLNSESQIRATERRERLEQQLPDPSSLASPSETPAVQLEKLKQELAQLQRRFKDGYPEVVRVRNEIAALERQIAASGSDGSAARGGAAAPPQRVTRSSSFTAIDRELESLKAEQESLRKAIAQYEGRVENAPRRQQELQQLVSEYDAVKERYQALSKPSEEAQLAENLEQGQRTEQFRILDPAIPSTAPSAPNRLWLLAMGFMASLGLGLGAIVVAEKLDTSFHTVDDVSAFTNIPALATIRVIPTAASVQRLRVRRALMAAAVVVSMAVVAAGARLVAHGNEQIVRMTARPNL